MATADSSSLATIKTKLSNHFIPVAQWLSSQSKESKNQRLHQVLHKRLQQILDAEGMNMITKSLSNLSTNTSQIGVVFSMSVNDTLVGGQIDSAILASFSEVAVNELIKNLKEKNFPEVRKWIV